MDTGLTALMTVVRFHQLPAEPEQLTHPFGIPESNFTDTEILLAEKSLTLKAKTTQRPLAWLKNRILPAIAKHRDSRYFIVARTFTDASDTQSLLIQEATNTMPGSLSQKTFEQCWSGELIMPTRSSGSGESSQDKFDISWLISSLIRYRKLFAEVVVASFFSQLSALPMPLFFQVVMDKGMVHRGFMTLDVLALGFFIVVVFEAFIGGFRNDLFRHTTNRVDGELGLRRDNHLLNLPLAYFESGQVGQNAVDTIRNFITATDTVKAMAVEPSMRHKLEDHLCGYVHASFRSQNLSNISNQIAGLINKLTTLGTNWLGAHVIIDGQISMGQLIAFNMLAGEQGSHQALLRQQGYCARLHRYQNESPSVPATRLHSRTELHTSQPGNTSCHGERCSAGPKGNLE